MAFGAFSRMAAKGGAAKRDDKTEAVRGDRPPPRTLFDAGNALAASSDARGEQASGAAERGKGASILKDRAARPYARRDTAKNALARFAASRRRNAANGAT